ncbi:MAG: hypothetical protein EA398_04820 [Deltaproteobacteria bacterium]|nr:MAG: hypothetical protein EA398_04820 [Deltaproteobacteria bacterium]
MVCAGEPENACGGCTPLDPVPGDPCGVCGRVVCDGAEATVCADRPPNVCGGCTDPGFEPGDPCEVCGEQAVVECSAFNEPVCPIAHLLNRCGGCTPLTAVPGTPCGNCGFIACTADGEGTRCLDPCR